MKTNLNLHKSIHHFKVRVGTICKIQKHPWEQYGSRHEGVDCVMRLLFCHCLFDVQQKVAKERNGPALELCRIRTF
jgi:hypothetical protein